MKSYKNPMVRGETVTILDANGTPTRGVLGATVEDANILVAYPDGEQGYVPESEIYEGPEPKPEGIALPTDGVL